MKKVTPFAQEIGQKCTQILPEEVEAMDDLRESLPREDNGSDSLLLLLSLNPPEVASSNFAGT